MGNNICGVPISAKTLREVCSECLSNIANYKGEDDVVYELKNLFLAVILLSKPRLETVTQKPSWACTHFGIQTRLIELQNIATRVLNDSGVEDKIIYLSEDTHIHLYYLLNKSDNFQAHIFGMGY